MDRQRNKVVTKYGNKYNKVNKNIYIIEVVLATTIVMEIIFS